MNLVHIYSPRYRVKGVPTELLVFYPEVTIFTLSFSRYLALGKSVKLWEMLAPATQSELRFDTQSLYAIACRELRLDQGTSEPYLRRPALKMTVIINGSWKNRPLRPPELLPVPQFYLAASPERKYGVAAASKGLQLFIAKGLSR